MSLTAPNQDFDGFQDAKGAALVLVQEPAGPKLPTKI